MKSIVMSESVTTNRYQQNNVKAGYLNKVPHWLYSVFVIGLFFYLSIAPIKITLASMSYHGVESKLDQWKALTASITKNDYERAKQGITQAIQYHPSFAYYYDIKSEVLQWGAFVGFETDLEANFSNIELLHEQSLQLRPIWSVTWGNLGQQKFYKALFLQKFDSITYSEIISYLTIAHQLGKQTPEIHMIWSDVGLRLLNINFAQYLNAQELLRFHVVKGLEYRMVRDKIIESIRASNNNSLVCIWLKQDARDKNQDTLNSIAFKRLKCS